MFRRGNHLAGLCESLPKAYPIGLEDSFDTTVPSSIIVLYPWGFPHLFVRIKILLPTLKGHICLVIVQFLGDIER